MVFAVFKWWDHFLKFFCHPGLENSAHYKGTDKAEFQCQNILNINLDTLTWNHDDFIIWSGWESFSHHREQITQMYRPYVAMSLAFEIFGIRYQKIISDKKGFTDIHWILHLECGWQQKLNTRSSAYNTTPRHFKNVKSSNPVQQHHFVAFYKQKGCR